MAIIESCPSIIFSFKTELNSILNPLIEALIQSTFSYVKDTLL